MDLTEGIEFLNERRDHLLYNLTDRIKLHFGSEEELIKELKEILRINNSLKLLKDASDTLPYVEEMNIKILNNCNKNTN